MLLQTPKQTAEIFISRQPIYDVNQDTFAYELLYQNSNEADSDAEGNDQLTSQVLLNVFMEIGLNQLFGDKLAFIDLAHSFLTEKHAIPFPKDKFILDIQVSDEIENALIDAIGALREQGFTIALDDFVYDETKKPLIEQCNIIKIDFKQIQGNDLSEMVVKLKPFKKTLLAKNVDTQEDFDFCKSIGFEYFQGSFLSKPKVVRYKTMASNKLLLLQILAKTQDPDVEFGELEELIGRDVGISYKLLRLINSANFGLSKKVESLHNALLLLGMKEIKSWAALVALSNIDSVPQELTDMSMMRAKMCKLLAEKSGAENSDTFFTVGMFSLLDALLGKPMPKLLETLPFSDDVNKALLEHKGAMGESLDCVIANEQGDWSQIKFGDLSSFEINEIYLEALEWSRNVAKQLV